MTNATQIKSASPTKLRDGSWGATVKGPATVGETIKITTKAGKSWEAKISKVVWTGNGVTIVATGDSGSSSGSKYTPRNTYPGYVAVGGHRDGYCGYNCPVSGRKCCPSNGPCHDCV